MQSQTSLVWILVVLVVIFGAVNIYFAATAGKPDLSGLATKNELNTLGSAVVNLGNNVVTKGEIANLATKEDLATITPVVPVIPEIPEIKIEGDIINKVNKLCELTKGCERWNMDEDEADILYDEVTDNNNKTLIKYLAKILDIDREDITILSIVVKDKIAYAINEDEADDGNYNAELFLKIKYDDDEDKETIYLHITGTVEDSTDVEVTSITKVDRNFELE